MNIYIYIYILILDALRRLRTLRTRGPSLCRPRIRAPLPSYGAPGGAEGGEPLSFAEQLATDSGNVHSMAG